MNKFVCKGEYIRLNFAKQRVCLLDPDHISMENGDLKKYVLANIADIKELASKDQISESSQKKIISYWARYYQAIVYARNECPYLDRDAISNKNLRTSYIPDDIEDTYELIPDTCIGLKCKCLLSKTIK